jgi:hypothetical protein
VTDPDDRTFRFPGLLLLQRRLEEYVCKVCAFDNQRKFPGEMSVGFPGINRVSLPAIGVCAVLWCAWTAEMQSFIPATKLERLKEGMDSVRFSGCVTDRSVIGD